MEWLVTNGVAAFLIPPGSLLLLGALGAMLMALRRRRLGVLMVTAAFLLLYAV